MNNGIVERMKSAAHALVSMEIERNPEIRDVEGYRRARLPEVYAEHQAAWREAYATSRDITISQLVAVVTGQRVEAQRVFMGKATANVERVHRICSEPVDPLTNLAGIAQAREALRSARQAVH